MKDIRCLALDVDGVLTDGAIIYTSEGHEIKSFNAKDGLGLGIAKKAGLEVVLISGRDSDIVRKRAAEVGVTDCILGCRNKSEALKEVCERFGITAAQIAYMGDDLNDYGVLQAVSLPICPCDACHDVRRIASRKGYVTVHRGGHGAVREAVEYILKRQEKWDTILEHFANESIDAKQ